MWGHGEEARATRESGLVLSRSRSLVIRLSRQPGADARHRRSDVNPTSCASVCMAAPDS